MSIYDSFPTAEESRKETIDLVTLSTQEYLEHLMTKMATAKSHHALKITIDLPKSGIAEIVRKFLEDKGYSVSHPYHSQRDGSSWTIFWEHV